MKITVFELLNNLALSLPKDVDGFRLAIPELRESSSF